MNCCLFIPAKHSCSLTKNIGQFLYQDFFEVPDVSGTWDINSEVTVEPTMEGVAFSTDLNDVMKPLMWYEIRDPDGWIFSLTYQIDLISDALAGNGGEDKEDFGDDHEGFPIHMVITTVNPLEASHIVWPEVDYLGFTSFTVVWDQATAEESHGSSSYITLNLYNIYEGYRTVKEYFGESTQLREGIAVEAPPFIAPADHNGSLYVVVVGAGNSTYNLKFVELGKTKMRSTLPAEYSCHARSHAISDAPPKLDCALASGGKSHKQCSSAFKYDSSYDGDATGCRITAERGSVPWCVLATDENGYCRDGCKGEDEGVTWDYCVEPVQRAECVEFCSKTVGEESGEACAEHWKTLTMPTLVSSCIADSRVTPGESWCAITVFEPDKTCASVRIGIYLCVCVCSARSYLMRCFCCLFHGCFVLLHLLPKGLLWL